MEQDSKRIEAMNQQHSETEEEVKARIEKEAWELYPDLDRYENSEYNRALRVGERWGWKAAALPRELEIARLRAELTALREKTVEIAGDAFMEGHRVGRNGSGPWSAQADYLDAVRREINSSSNKG